MRERRVKSFIFVNPPPQYFLRLAPAKRRLISFRHDAQIIPSLSYFRGSGRGSKFLLSAIGNSPAEQRTKAGTAAIGFFAPLPFSVTAAVCRVKSFGGRTWHGRELLGVRRHQQGRDGPFGPPSLGSGPRDPAHSSWNSSRNGSA